jgi:hypothetical protein
MPRPAHIPQDIWLAAKGVSVRFASDEEITRMAEMLMRRRDGVSEPIDEDRVKFWPGMTARGVRITRDALFEYETVIDDDVSELFRLRSIFDAEARVRGKLTGAQE